MVVTFSNKLLDHINMTSLHNNEFCQFPIKNVHLSRTFKYPAPLGRKIFNSNSFSKSFSSDTNFRCECNDSAYKTFINGGHGHIITGNLKIVSDLHLRKLMGYSTKFRLTSSLSVKQMRFCPQS